MGVKAEVEKSRPSYQAFRDSNTAGGEADKDEDAGDEGGSNISGSNEWVELTVEIPGFRDDDSMPVFLAAMLSEALLADREFTRRLRINRRFHWKIYLDVSLKIILNKRILISTDIVTLTTALIPSSTSFSHHPFGNTFHKVAEVDIGIG